MSDCEHKTIQTNTVERPGYYSQTKTCIDCEKQLGSQISKDACFGPSREERCKHPNKYSGHTCPDCGEWSWLIIDDDPESIRGLIVTLAGHTEPQATCQECEVSVCERCGEHHPGFGTDEIDHWVTWCDPCADDEHENHEERTVVGAYDGDDVVPADPGIEMACHCPTCVKGGGG